jgi:hypothetical protein
MMTVWRTSNSKLHDSLQSCHTRITNSLHFETWFSRYSLQFCVNDVWTLLGQKSHLMNKKGLKKNADFNVFKLTSFPYSHDNWLWTQRRVKGESQQKELGNLEKVKERTLEAWAPHWSLSWQCQLWPPHPSIGLYCSFELYCVTSSI